MSEPDWSDEDDLARQRDLLVRRTISGRDIDTPEVLRALQTVPRHRFMAPEHRELAYSDRPAPIGFSQTISQPYIVAKMIDVAELGEGSRVLDIGTGSGYQAAVLAELGCEVYSIEIIEALAQRARKTLDATGYERVHTRIGDGYEGWEDAAPFDAILIAAAPDHVPKPLLEQLVVGGVIVLPVGTRLEQDLLCIRKTETGFIEENVCPVLFVPMTGTAQAGR